jgi:hypothetical protein
VNSTSTAFLPHAFLSILCQLLACHRSGAWRMCSRLPLMPLSWLQSLGERTLMGSDCAGYRQSELGLESSLPRRNEVVFNLQGYIISFRHGFQTSSAAIDK